MSTTTGAAADEPTDQNEAGQTESGQNRVGDQHEVVRPTAIMPLFQAVVAGSIGAGLLILSFPEPGWWWAAFPAVALLWAALRGRSIGGAVLVGILAGLTFHLGLLRWATLFLGPLPWAALGVEQALWWIPMAIAWTLTSRWLPHLGRWGTRLVPVVAGGLWLGRETLAGAVPYEGFAWGRIGQAQGSGPLVELASWIGVTGLTLLVATVSVAAVELALAAANRPAGERGPVAITAAAILVTLIALALVPIHRLPVTDSITVAAIQGGSDKAGYFNGGEPGEVRQAHALATDLLEPGSTDLIVWPEAAAEWDSANDRTTGPVLDAVYARHQTPMLVGWIRREGDLYHTSYAPWPRTDQVYDKHRPVPFGEYVPDRELWRRFAPELIDLIGRDFTPGTGAPVLEAAGTTVGVAICYDIIDDDLMREMVANDAGWIVSPTNNADFGRTDELWQQTQIAQLRAVESGRTVVQASTVGPTIAFGPDGRVLAQADDIYTPAAVVVEVEVRTGATAAMTIGPGLAWTWQVTSVLLLVVAGVVKRVTSNRIA
ncbi:apolipoprotein N-acyltransferase [Parenemella sanctibonifatiensis]|uniref:Apolipoprotein N-acyltransferase n=1 Tax=Parenemella sanctibonifatiensis TaxID=2016505 RepID=A0A255EI24_9ACTN|nr:apolipoprotein N-acyltransferase [Parenemella sanctibonifatiensis]OYN91174.1 apolipoprotein N-acyltransferase [Parenemella sanctibonifatiensis]